MLYLIFEKLTTKFRLDAKVLLSHVKTVTESDYYYQFGFEFQCCETSTSVPNSVKKLNQSE